MGRHQPSHESFDIGHVKHLKGTPFESFLLHLKFFYNNESKRLGDMLVHWIGHSSEDIVAAVSLTHLEGFIIGLNAVALSNILRFHSNVVAEVRYFVGLVRLNDSLS